MRMRYEWRGQKAATVREIEQMMTRHALESIERKLAGRSVDMADREEFLMGKFAGRNLQLSAGAGRR